MAESSISIPGSFSTSPAAFSQPATPSSPSASRINHATKPSKASSMRLASSSVHSFPKKSQFNIDEILSDENEVVDAWGTDGGANDLIDMDRDEGDWGGFEEAPTPLYPSAPSSSHFSSVNHHADDSDDPWGSDSKPKPTPTRTRPNPAPAVKPTPKAVKASAVPTPRPAPPAVVAKPIESAPPVSLSALSKEDKEKEMARRREERKARIAELKKSKA